MDDKDLLRVEHYRVDSGAGKCSAVIVAGAWSSIYNKLGHAAQHFAENSSPKNIQLCVNLLSGYLMRFEKARGSDATDAAIDALGWYRDRWCWLCKGAEALNPEQDMCPTCRGARYAPQPDSKLTRKAIIELLNAEEFLDRQISKRMNGYEAPKRTASTRIGYQYGWYRLPCPTIG